MISGVRQRSPNTYRVDRQGSCFTACRLPDAPRWHQSRRPSPATPHLDDLVKLLRLGIQRAVQVLQARQQALVDLWGGAGRAGQGKAGLGRVAEQGKGTAGRDHPWARLGRPAEWLALGSRTACSPALPRGLTRHRSDVHDCGEGVVGRLALRIAKSVARQMDQQSGTAGPWVARGPLC